MADLKNDIKKYLSGQMSSAEMHALEKKAMNDPFLADALEGAESIGPKEFASDLTELESRILRGKGKNSWFWPLRIAASFLVITTAALLVYNSLPTDQPEKLAEQKTSEPPATESSGPSEEDEKKADENLLSLNQPKKETPLRKEKQDLAKIDEAPTTAPTAEEAPAAKYGQGALVTDEIKAEEESVPMAEVLQKEIATTLAESKKEIASDKDEPSRAKSSSPASTQYLTQRRAQGRVTADDGTALSGVNVIIKGSSIGTVTDAAGNYSLPLPTDTSKLQFSALDRKSRDISGGADLDIKLKEDEEQPNEVVVTGFELTQTKNEKIGSVLKLAEPLIGRIALKKYMQKNLRYPTEALQRKIEGKVVIEFLVLPDGSLTDFRVLKGIGFGCDEEVIRLIKEGSAWSPTLQNNIAVREKVRVQLRFKLP
jgi:TonB family protein